VIKKEALKFDVKIFLAISGENKWKK